MTQTTNKAHTNRILTQVQITEALAKSQGFEVKKNAVVIDGLMPSGILVRRPHEREFSVLHLIPKGDRYAETVKHSFGGFPKA